MKQLSYQVLAENGYSGYLLPKAPERVLQFGEGNFLRAFADYFIDIANETAGFDSKVVVVQPIAEGLCDTLNDQEGLYTLSLRGCDNGEKTETTRVISSISRAINPYRDYKTLLDCAANPQLRYIISNTTEAGIAFDAACRFDDAPPASFPGKLTRFLYERFQKFGGSKESGLVILACELIDHNGEKLQECVEEYIKLWALEPAFGKWVAEDVLFCSTLVDRIVTGYPRQEADALNAKNGYEDRLLDTGEVFGLWVIEGPEWLGEELPFEKAGLPVKVVRDHMPYKQRKVRILNGAHTTLVPAAYLAGKDIVRDCMEDDVIQRFLGKAMQEEIIPTLTLPKEELRAFADSVIDRFRNPFIDHSLLAISLNSTSKWAARVLPTLKDYTVAQKKLPACLTFGFAAYVAFFRGCKLENGKAFALRNGEKYPLSDDMPVLEFFAQNGALDNAELVRLLCARADFWGENLNDIPGFTDAVAADLDSIGAKGMYAAIADCL